MIAAVVVVMITIAAIAMVLSAEAENENPPYKKTKSNKIKSNKEDLQVP